jgi:hypothetical protein
LRHDEIYEKGFCGNARYGQERGDHRRYDNGIDEILKNVSGIDVMVDTILSRLFHVSVIHRFLSGFEFWRK